MPQIWMTYDELGELAGCSGSDARNLAIAMSLDRKKSRDGLSRAKLNADLSQRYFTRIRSDSIDTESIEIDTAVNLLRSLHAQMGRPVDVRRAVGT